jgi:hypothetical protein
LEIEVFSSDSEDEEANKNKNTQAEKLQQYYVADDATVTGTPHQETGDSAVLGKTTSTSTDTSNGFGTDNNYVTAYESLAKRFVPVPILPRRK